MPRTFLVVHGVVQGVGYRHFVWRTAEMCGVSGFVRNADDGSVEILADGTDENLKWFMKEINIDMKDGPQVFKIDQNPDSAKRYLKNKYDEFKIEG